MVERLVGLRQHQQNGKRSSHKQLLVLLTLGQLSATGSSERPWSLVEDRLARLLQDYGPPSQTSAAQSAAFPFTRLRSDGIWSLDHDVPMARVLPLAEHDVVGRPQADLEVELADPDVLHAAARALVEAEFPTMLAADVLADVGLDADLVLALHLALAPQRQSRRDASWRPRC